MCIGISDCFELLRTCARVTTEKATLLRESGSYHLPPATDLSISNPPPLSDRLARLFRLSVPSCLDDSQPRCNRTRYSALILKEPATNIFFVGPSLTPAVYQKAPGLSTQQQGIPRQCHTVHTFHTIHTLHLCDRNTPETPQKHHEKCCCPRRSCHYNCSQAQSRHSQSTAVSLIAPALLHSFPSASLISKQGIKK